MLRRCLPYLLLLLVSSAGFDDAWAFATPDPIDDLQAAENNEYLPVSLVLGGRFGSADLPPVALPAASPAGLLPSLALGPWLRTSAAAARAAPSLYLFMSLQC